MMQTRSFRAASMSEALAQVKRELGPDAVIVSTRTTRRGGLIGMSSRTITEITAHASTQTTEARRPPAAAPPGPHHPGLRTGGGDASSSTQTSVGFRVRETTEATMHYRIDRAAQAFGRAGAASATDPLLERSGRALGIDAARPSTAPAVAPVVTTSSVIPARVESAARPLAADAAEFRTAPIDPSIREELNALRAMMGQMLRGQRTRPQPRMSDPLFDVYLKLIESEVADEIADEVIGEVRDTLIPEQLRDPAAIREAVIHRLSRLIPTSSKPSAIERDPRGRPYTIAFIGPTGVGKTTTLAKLAATLKLREGKKVGLITCDTYRIAAVDQLRTYASIIGLPIRVALTPAEVEQACEALSDCDAILIDTAGRSPRDRGRIEELSRFLKAGRPHEVHLVLSSASSVSVLDAAVERFGTLGPDHVIFTKIDEAVNFGVLLGVIGKVNARLSFITTGQEVPEHIERCDARRIAELVLGGERVA
jgi:flagellar biosynthesis protein FlhF